MQDKALVRIRLGQVLETRSDFLLVFFIVARQAFRYVPGFSGIWPLARYAFYFIVGYRIIRTPKIRKNIFFGWEIAFLAMAFLCSFLSKYSDNAISKCIEVFFMLVDVTCIVQYCLPERKLEVVFRAFLLSGAAIAMIQLSNFSIAAINTGTNQILNRFSLSEFENPNITALKLYVSVISGFYLLYFKCGFFKTTVILTGLSSVAMVLTGSRKTFIIAVIVAAILFISGKKKYLKVALLVIGSIVAYDIIMTNTVIYNIIGWRLESLSGGADASAIERSRLRLDAINTGLEHIFLGVGLNNSMYYTSIGMYAHNNYAEIFADLGLFGLLIFYSLYLVMFNRIFSCTNRRERCYWLLFIFSFLAIDYGQVSYNLFSCIMPMAILSLNFLNSKQCDHRF